MVSPIVANQQFHSWQQPIYEFRIEHLPNLKGSCPFHDISLLGLAEYKKRFSNDGKAGALRNCLIFGGMPSI